MLRQTQHDNFFIYEYKLLSHPELVEGDLAIQ